jgi:hypothetical protein
MVSVYLESQAARDGNYEFSSKHSKVLQFYHSVHSYHASHLHYTDAKFAL